MPDDDYHTLVTLLVIVLIAVFIWLYILTIKNKRRQEPGYVPKVLRAGFMQRFQFVKKLRDVEAENAKIMEEDSKAVTIDEDQDVDSVTPPDNTEEISSVDP